ncbi:MAG: HAD-IIB family hydrolase [Hyphomicrobiales bacterium]
MNHPIQSLVFTDLDGTLLDHETYDWSPAKPALAGLAQHNIPVIFVTSKTAAEVMALREEIGNCHPFIVENGGAVFIPKGCLNKATDERIVLGADRPTITDFLKKMREAGHHFESFQDMGTKGIIDTTGLDEASATLANQREASEPLVYHSNSTMRETFIMAASKQGLAALQGGRFLSVGGLTDKGQAATTLVERYRAAGHPIQNVIALGDSQNDTALLKVASHPIWVRKKGPSPDSTFQINARCTLKHGPSGWHDAILDVLGEIEK